MDLRGAKSIGRWPFWHGRAGTPLNRQSSRQGHCDALKYQSRVFKNAEKSMLIVIARVSHLGRIKSLVQGLSQYP